VHLSASDTTPAQGADFALTARFVGGAQLESNLSTLLPRTGQEVGLTASLRLGDANLPLRAAEALIRRPDGTTERVTLAVRESVSQADLRPRLPGLYGIDITVMGLAADGSAIERSAFLAFEAQPEAAPGLPPSIWIGAALGLILVSGLAARSIRRRRRNESSSI
jgi:hypothetical protein